MNAEPRLYGPRKVSKAGQVAIPKELMRQLDIAEGDALYMAVWKGRIVLLGLTELGPRLQDLLEELGLEE